MIFVFLRWLQYGGHTRHAKSPRGWWHHFWWSLDGITEYAYEPRFPRYDLKVPPPIYRGTVKATAAKQIVTGEGTTSGQKHSSAA